MELSPIAQKIFDRKYSRTLPNGKTESWEQAVTRVASYVASAEETEDLRLQYTAEFVKLMYEKSFLPGGRIIANAGTGIKNLMNCFVLPVEDSRRSIYETLGNSAEVFAWGGGVGYNFSNLRPSGSVVKTTGGIASGPVSFMDLFNTTGEVISQASRRGAQMGILNITHPDIVKFITYKSGLSQHNENILKSYDNLVGEFVEQSEIDTLKKVLADTQLMHFNLSVGITDAFMDAYINDEMWVMESHGVRKEMKARDLMRLIAESAWKNGDPGLYFIDTANKSNLVPYMGRLDATNPCGEVPLLPYEACCLGSINLYAFVDGGYVDYPYLAEVIKLAVRFLDNVQTLNETPVSEINKATRATRRLGLGVMGWADMLAEMGYAYDSEDARVFAERLGEFIKIHSWRASIELAKEKGTFDVFDAERINWDYFNSDSIPDGVNLRNVAVTSIAPNGTISLLSDVNSGIEPFFSRKYIRNITDGVGTTVKDSLEQEVAFENVKVAHEISPIDHIKMQAAWQKNIDNAISKTINMPESATVEDILDAYVFAYKQGCKGITVYRNNSKSFQILN